MPPRRTKTDKVEVRDSTIVSQARERKPKAEKSAPERNGPELIRTGDNLDAAAAAALADGNLVRETNTNAVPGDPASAQVNIRTTEESRDRWKECAEKLGVSVAELARDLLDAKAEAILDCAHARVKSYPWSMICLDCGKRLK